MPVATGGDPREHDDDVGADEVGDLVDRPRRRLDDDDARRAAGRPQRVDAVRQQLQHRERPVASRSTVWSAALANGSAGERAESRPASTSHTGPSSAAITAASGVGGVDERRVGLLRRRRRRDDVPVADRRRAAGDEVGAGQVGRPHGEGEGHQAGLDADAELGAEPPAVRIGLDDDARAGSASGHAAASPSTRLVAPGEPATEPTATIVTRRPR